MKEDVIGYRFRPYDEEIISHYLDNKLKDLPDNYIKEVDILEYEPWELPGICEARSAIAWDDEWYFLWAPDNKFANRKRTSRMTKAGYWKVTGKERTIRNKKHKVIGTKRTLVFHLRRGTNAESVKWVITEYHSCSDNSRSDQKEYVVCRLKKKPNDKFDTTTCHEPSPQSAADNRNHVTENLLALENVEPSAGESPRFTDSERQLLMDLLYSTSNDEHNTPKFQSDVGNHGSDFVNSLLVDEDEYSLQETVRTHHHGFDSPESLTGVYFQSSTHDSDNKILNVETVQSSLPRDVADRLEQQMQSYEEPLGHIPHIGSIYTINVLTRSDDLVDWETSPSRSHESMESVTSPRKSYELIESETGRRWIDLQGQSTSFKEEERGGAAEDTIVDSAQRKKSVVKSKKEEKKIPRKSISKVSDGSKRKGYFINQELPPSASTPPFVYIVNVLIAVLLFVFFVWEMVYIR